MKPTADSPTPLGLQASFGFGDRIGLATPGHVAAARLAGGGIAPIFAQQSIREMTRTGRSPETVMRDALEAVRAADWSGPMGADADHLKTPEDVDRTAAAGFTMFTIDPSADVDGGADTYDASALRTAYARHREALAWTEAYRGQTIRLSPGLELTLDEPTVMRAAVKYGRAVNTAVALSRHIDRVQSAAGRPYEIELSVDETDEPTTLAEHYLIADRCLREGMRLVSLAPRFVGHLEKGVDYIGDLEAFARSLEGHCALAARLGPYKLSLHSGSDKISMYTLFARATAGRFHVKTAGTSYLEALRVAAIEAPELFRRLVVFARERYDTDKATYHVHATLDAVPPPESVREPRDLERLYLECWEEVPEGRGFTAPGRQIMHCTFGSVLTHPEHGPALVACLRQHAATYAEVLKDHFARHLRALSA